MKRGGFLARFAAVVAREPSRVAIESGGRRVTYAELLRRAAALGERLRARGAGPGSAVGIEYPKSSGYVVAMLGIWSAGAAFVPLDPALPKRLRRFLARDSGLAHVVTPRGVRREGAGESGAADRAYILYTSGTTGRPKGVVVPHRGIVNLLDAQIRAFRMDPASRSLLYLSTSFDASISDIGTALLAGGTLCIEPDASLSGAGLLRTLHERRITHLDLPPSLLRVLDRDAMPASLRTLIIGGEAADPAVVRRWAERFRVVNVYGPTEATVCSSMCVCDARAWTRPLLGRPLPGVRWRILDEHRRDVRARTPGELFLGGIGLADGYRNLPELDAERFVDVAGERMFATGDRVVADRGGEVEFLGRIDRQVKVRGLRVEPEGIEAELRRHPAVREAAVVTRIGPSGRTQLVAVASLREVASASALRAHLRRTLPAWMIPQRVELLRRLPRTITGKVDLASLSREPAAAPRRIVAPSGRVETALARIWEELLGVRPVGATDDFFDDLGGDSLAVVGLSAAAEIEGLAIPPGLLATCRTIRSLAARLEKRRGRPLTSAARLRADVEHESRNLRSSSRGVPAFPPREILLTGATGFLGSRLLGELLDRTDARVWCLVRGSADDVHAALASHGRRPFPAGRVEIVRGDLERSRFGLARQAWDSLADRVDAVYHAAANVNVVLPYRSLRAANVGGTREVLRFVAFGRRKALHHVSTLSVFVSTDRDRGAMRESDTLRRTRHVYGGYAQSKWAAETLLRAARGIGPIVFYRLGLVTGDSRTGRASRSDMLSLFFSGLASMRSVPESAASFRVDVTPVDFAAAAIAHLSLESAPASGSTFHIANPESASLTSLVDALRAEGIPIAVESDESWRSRRVAGVAESSAWLALCRCLPRGAFERHRAIDLFQATGADFRMERALAGIAGSGIACPPPRPALLRLYARTAIRG